MDELLCAGFRRGESNSIANIRNTCVKILYRMAQKGQEETRNYLDTTAKRLKEKAIPDTRAMHGVDEVTEAPRPSVKTGVNTGLTAVRWSAAQEQHGQVPRLGRK